MVYPLHFTYYLLPTTYCYNVLVIYSLSGELQSKSDKVAIIAVGGVGFKISAHARTLNQLPATGGKVQLFCHLHVREDALDLYGFLSPEELELFELLNSVAGVGPKSALSILEIADHKQVAAAIKEGRPDMLTRASGIGRKTGERIVLELRNKVVAEFSQAALGRMATDVDLAEALVGLGYPRDQAKEVLRRVDEKTTNLEQRLKEALKILGKK
ncbi:MAG: Holliday junction branch migration protein RuvA [Patescibacteria group bacterium]